MSIGIVGCGAIGSAVGRAVQRPPLARAFRLSGLHDRNPAQAARLRRRLRPRVPVLSLPALIRRSQVILEATSAAAAGAIIRQSLRAGRTVVPLSVGGILPLAHHLPRLTRRGGRLVIPSGAIAGLDAVRAARLGRLQRVTLTTRKPPAAYRGAPGARLSDAQLAALRRPAVLFRGSAARAVRGFPQNINVAATLSLAGLGPQRTQVRIIADPGVTRNCHEIEAIGPFGRLTVRTENVPSAGNPKTSQLALLSVLATLHAMTGAWRVGT